MPKYIYIIVNQNGISMTVVARDEHHAYLIVEAADYSVSSIREIGTAYDTTEFGIIE